VPSGGEAPAGQAARWPWQYEVCVHGHLGKLMRLAFPDLRAETRGADTVLTGELPDTSALYGVLAEMETLGLELIEVRRLRSP
jgi:hypothetical protein